MHVPSPTLSALEVGAETRLHTHLHVRETEMELFGASDAGTLALFKLLLTVSGVGPKVALATLSVLDASRLSNAILSEDVAQITSVPGIGKKTAQRIILDLRSKVEGEAAHLAGPDGTPATPIASGIDPEAVEALIALGYTRGEARRALAGVDPGQPLEQRIVAAIQLISG